MDVVLRKNSIRPPISKDMDLNQTIDLMSLGDKYVKKLLIMCADVDHMLLLHLDDMNMRGRQIWTAFYYYCEGIFEKFRVCVTQRNLDMVHFVNKNCPGPRAKQSGAAPKA